MVELIIFHPPGSMAEHLLTMHGIQSCRRDTWAQQHDGWTRAQADAAYEKDRADRHMRDHYAANVWQHPMRHYHAITDIQSTAA